MQPGLATTFIVFIYFLGLIPSLTTAQTVQTLTLSRAVEFDGLYVDSDGILYGAAGFEGSELSTVGRDGKVSTFVSEIVGPVQSVKLLSGEMFITNFVDNQITKVDVSGNAFRFVDVKPGPSGIVADAAGNLFVSHFGTGNGNGNSISKITPEGVVTDFASGGTLDVPVGLAIDEDRNIYAANFYDGRITKITPSGSKSLYGSIESPGTLGIGHLVWANGKLYATHFAKRQVYVFEEGVGSVYAGTGEAGQLDGPAATATFTSPNGIAASITGDTLYVAEAGEARTTLRMIIAEGISTDVVDEQPDMPASLQLKANYPNPFSGETQIQFSIARSEQVRLEIFDVLGRKVDTLVDQVLPAGDHDIVWRPEDVVPGLYLYRVQTNSEVQMSNMVLQ